MIVLAAEKLTRGDNKGALDTLDDIPKARQNELSVLFLRIRVYERLGDQANIEATLRKLVDTNPKEPAYKRELVRYLVTNKRIDDAEKIMRDLAAENPTDSKTGLELVSFLNMTKGPAAARAELRERIAKGGSNVFAYQIADADLDFALGKTDEATQALKTLISNLKEPSEILQARTHLAEMYLARKNVAAGEAIVNDILQTDGRSTDGLRLRATIRIDRGQLEEAIADLRQALNDQPKSPALLTLMGLAFERSGQIDLADKQYADAMRAANFSPQSGLTYVGFLKRRGILGHAENVLAELAQRNPNNPQILAALAQEKLEQKDWNAAQEIANALRKDNKAAAADQITAAALLGQNKLDEGLGALKSAYEANPNALQPMYALVRGYIQAKQVDKAEAFLDSILKANPSNAEALVLRGLTKLASNSPDLAVQNFKQAIEKQPKNPVGYGALADYYVQRGDNDTAIATLKDGLRQQPGAFALQLAYAGILEKKGEYDAAITEYEKMLKDQPGSLIVANNLASLLTDQRSDQASRERAMVVAAPLAKSQVPQFKDTLGWLYYQRGEYQNAVPLLEEAAASLPNNAWVKYHLGLTYAATGANEKATEQLQKALALEQNGDSSLKTKIQAALNK
jgi:tetratricopeptide (TPR) repeat protein